MTVETPLLESGLPINADPERSADEKGSAERLSRLHLEVDVANPDLGSIVKKAKKGMGLLDTENSRKRQG